MTIKNAVRKISYEINERESEITSYDQKVGDGDHAINLKRGFDSIILKLDSISDDPSDIFAFIGKELMNVVGGTSGAIYGIAFLAGALACKNKTWNFQTLITMISTAAQRITKSGGATIGEKTLYDVWGSVDKYKNNIKNVSSLKINIIKYMNSTKQMSATKGRASYIGERSIGIVDPGAVTSEIIIRHLSETIE